MTATGEAQAAAAAHHIREAVNALAALVTKLDTLRGAVGGIDASAKDAAGHLEGVADVIGSKTAAELASIIRGSLDRLHESLSPNLSEALESCKDEATLLNAVFKRAEELSQQLGA